MRSVDMTGATSRDRKLASALSPGGSLIPHQRIQRSPCCATILMTRVIPLNGVGDRPMAEFKFNL